MKSVDNLLQMGAVLIYLCNAKKSTLSNMLKQNTKLWMLAAIMAFTTSAYTQDLPNAENGKKLFEVNCVSCHAIDKKVIGPALRGIHQRRTSEWLVQWIRNNEKFRKVTKDPDAIAVYNENNGASMNAFENLTPANVLEIVEYIKTAPEAPKTAVVIDSSNGTNKQDNTNLYVLLILVAIFSIVLFILARVKNTLRRIAAEKNPEEYAELLAPKKGLQPALNKSGQQSTHGRPEVSHSKPGCG